MVDAAAPRTSREPVFFSDVPLEDEVLKGYVIGPSGRVLGGRLIPMGAVTRCHGGSVCDAYLMYAWGENRRIQMPNK